MKNIKLHTKILLVLIMFIGFSCCPNKDSRPNIILIMTDDMGYSDIGCYGGEIYTPNIDNLANNGIRLTQFYNSARCCPTRASLLTGLYPHQTGIGLMTNPPGSKGEDLGLPAYRGSLNQSNITLAEVLKTAGYRTYMTGKWHLGFEPENHPIERGFDKFYGLIAGASNHFKPEGARSVWEGKQKISVDDDFYTTDNFTDKAIEFINDEEPGEPFFLYLAYTAPHWPLHAPAEDIEKYKGRYS
ncbi:MAG: sulfatase-like hydrolase/transferase, partial [Bacteroidales bacterium]|nr:sulfatase-like hydrolase/transferase [Bacteroidales bacterium]